MSITAFVNMNIAREVLYSEFNDSATWRRMIFQNLERNIEREIINYVQSISVYNSEISQLMRNLKEKVYEEL
jgi:hypothetical protein